MEYESEHEKAVLAGSAIEWKEDAAPPQRPEPGEEEHYIKIAFDQRDLKLLERLLLAATQNRRTLINEILCRLESTDLPEIQ